MRINRAIEAPQRSPRTQHTLRTCQSPTMSTMVCASRTSKYCRERSSRFCGDGQHYSTEDTRVISIFCRIHLRLASIKTLSAPKMWQACSRDRTARDDHILRTITTSSHAHSCCLVRATFVQHSCNITCVPAFKRQPFPPTATTFIVAALPALVSAWPPLHATIPVTQLNSSALIFSLMNGAAFLCPLLGADDGDGGIVAATDGSRITDVFIDPRAVQCAPTEENSTRPALLLANFESGLVPRSEMPQTISDEVIQRLPEWAQIIIRSGCYEPTASSQLPQKRPSTDNGPSRSDEAKRKRPRSSQKNQALRVAVNGDGDEEMPMTLDSEPGDDDDDGSMRSVFSVEERVADHVGKYTEAIQGLLAAARRRREATQVDVDGEATDVFTDAEVKALLQSIKVMDKSGLIIKCDHELLLSLLSAMDMQVQVGAGIDVFAPMVGGDQGDKETRTSGIDLRLVDRMQFSLDVAICELHVMATPNIERRVLSEEMIDNCMQLLTHTIQKLLLPCIDPSSSASLLASAAASSAGDGSTTTPGAKLGAIARSFNVKHNKQVKKAIDRLLPVVCESMQLLSQLITTVKLSDRWILHFSSLMSKLFAIEHGPQAQLLQRSSLTVLRTIYLTHPSHRSIMLDDVITVIQKLPTAKRNLRTVKLAGSATHVQMITTLVVGLIQAPASIMVEPATKSETQEVTKLPRRVLATNGDDDEDEKEEVVHIDQTAVERLQPASESARIFVSALLKECLKKNEERDNRVVIENLVEDLLAMFGLPEWSGAELLLEAFSTSLAAILAANLSKDSKKLESQYSLTALNLVGRICAAIRMSQNAARGDLFDDKDSRLVYQEHEEYLRDWLESASGVDADDIEHVDRGLVLKHMVVTFIRRSLHDVTSEDSKNVLLARFLCEEPSKRGYTKLLPGLWNGYWSAKESGGVSIDSSSKLAPPQVDLAQRASRQLAVSREFCAMFDTLMKHLMALLSRGIPTFRARVMKALSGIVDVDPMLMAESGVQATVCRCFLDEATSVRQAAVDLVGKYVELHPLLFERYFEMLCDRLRDKGISVRKSVCKIFRTYLTIPVAKDAGETRAMDDELRRRSACMRNLVERIGDATEEEVVKNFIIDTFQEVWFGSELSSRQLSELDSFEDDPDGAKVSVDNHGAPPGWSVVEHDEDDDEEEASRKRKGNTKPSTEFVSPEGNAYGSAEEAWAAYRKPLVTPSSVVKNKRSKVDDTPDAVSTIIEVIHDMATMDWFIALLKRLLHDDTGGKVSAARRSSRDRTDEVSIALARSEKIVACLIEGLVQIEEGKEIRGVTVTDMDAQFLSCMKALSAFAEAHPLLLSPHLEVIMVYLKGDDKLSKATEAKVQGLVVNIVANVIAQAERVTERIATMLEADLKNLVFRAPPSVVSPSIKCLATLSTFTRRPPTMLFKMLETFFGYLVKFQKLESLANIRPDASSSLQRALFTAGQIGGSLDFDSCSYALPVPTDPALSKLTKGSIMDALYEVYSSYLRVPGSPACTAKAIQGLGFLFMLRPRFLLQTQQDGLFDRLLQAPAIEICLQTLTSLKELLQHEEQRLEKGLTRKKSGPKDKSKKKQVQGDQDGEASLIGGVMQAQLQNILPLSLEKHVRVRSEAVACIAVLLTQGLVSPLHCIPNLVALEADQVVSIRDTAHGQLVALHEKFPTLVHQPSIQGIHLSHSFQLKAFGKCTVYALDKDKKEYCLFGRLYTNCLRPSRTHRTMFLRALVNQFSDKGNVLTPANLKGEPLRVIDYLSYLAYLITALPYDVEDEPLFIIYLINRYATLKLGPLLQDLKKEFKVLGIEEIDLKHDEFNLGDVDITPYVARGGGLATDRMKSLLGRCCVAFAINLLLRIKFYLKDVYGLDNEKCQTYQPGSATKATDQNVSLTELSPPPLQIPSADDLERMENPLELNWFLLLHTWRAAQEDISQLDFEAHEEPTRGGKKKRPLRRRKAVVKDDDVDDEFVQGFDG